MSELEKCIGQWRTSLKTFLGDSDEIVDELESHLREEINRRMQAGDTVEAAFSTAQAKLGRPADLAAEYARAAAPAIWLPVSIGIPLAILVFAFFNWSVIVEAIAMRNAHWGVMVATRGSYIAVIFYTACVGICYVVSRHIRPMSLGQLQSLRRSLIVGNASLTLFSLFSLYAVIEGWLFPLWGWNWSIFIEVLLPMFWTATLAMLLWIDPKRLHRWTLLSLVSIPVIIWGDIGLRWILELRPENGFRQIHSVAIWLYTTIPLLFALIGILPARHAVHRIAE